MKKYSILFVLAYVAAAFVWLLIPEAVSAKEKKIGIKLYSVMDAMQKDPEASLTRLTGMGYNVLELVQWGGDTKVFGMPAD